MSMLYSKIISSKNKFLTALTFVFITIIYLWFKSDSVGYGDALGFLTSVTRGFDLATNATSNFLYVNLLSAFAHIVPGGSLFDKTLLFSIIFSLATLVQVFRIGRLITQNIVAALGATILLGLSFTYWRQTEIIEVYTFNNFLFTSMLYYIVKDYLTKDNNRALLVSVIFGLALLAHIQNILLIPFFLIYLYLTVLPNYKKAACSLLIVAGLFSILLLIPLIWQTNSILSVFFENDNFKDKATSLNFYGLLKGAGKSIGYFLYNFLFLIYFILHGGYLLYKRDKKLLLFLSLAFLPFWAFVCRFDVPDSYVFLLQPCIVFALISVYSFDFWAMKYSFSPYLIPLQLISMPLAYFFIWQLSLTIPQLDSVNQKKAYKGGLKYLVWPGMKDNGGLLKLSKKIYLTGQKPENFEEFKWNYDIAINYLKLTGQLNEGQDL